MSEHNGTIDKGGRPIDYNGLPLVIGNLPDFRKPVAFIDFDGVLNVFPDSRTVNSDRLVNKRIRGIRRDMPCEQNSIHVKYDPEIIAALKGINAVWCTSWNQLTQNKLNPLLGLDWGYVAWKYRGPSDSGVYGKTLYIARISNLTGCKWVSVDDALIGFKDILASETGRDGLLINPADNEGLTLEDIERIIEYGCTK